MAEPPPTADRAAVPRAGTPRRSDLFVAAALVALVLAVFGPAVRFDFVPYDDDTYLLDNAAIRGGLDAATVKWSFGFRPGYQYYPLTWLSHALDFSLFGSDPAGHHAVSVALHALSTALLFLFFSRTTGETGASALVAAVFGAHPLRTESVVWISERKDVLSVFLAMALLVAWAAGSKRSGAVRVSAAALVLLAGLLAKPMLVTLPVLLLLVDVWPLRRLQPGTGARGLRPLVLEKVPLLALALAAAAVAVLAQGASGALASLETSPLGHRVAVALHSVAWYVGKTFVPEGLSVFYPLVIPAPAAIAAGAAILALFLGAALHPRVPLPVRTGLTWYLVALAPVCGLVRVGDQLVADRYSYLPSIGLAVAAVFGLKEVLSGTSRALHVGAVTASVVVAAYFSVAAAIDASRFRDGLTLFSAALETDPSNWLAHAKVGDELVRRGRGPESLPHYAAAYRLRPEWDAAAGNLAQALANTGRTAEALATVEAGLARNPSSQRLHLVASALHERAGHAGRAKELRARADALQARPSSGARAGWFDPPPGRARTQSGP